MARGETRRIQTEAGALELELLGAPHEQLRRIARHWRMGAVVSSPQSGQPHGLVFQIGDEETRGFVLQSLPTDGEQAWRSFHLYRALTPRALPGHVARGHRGVMAPCACLCEHPAGEYVVGVALFVGPDAASRCERGAPGDDDPVWGSVVASGFERLEHVPLVPVSLPEQPPAHLTQDPSLPAPEGDEARSPVPS